MAYAAGYLGVVTGTSAVAGFVLMTAQDRLAALWTRARYWIRTRRAAHAVVAEAEALISGRAGQC